MFRALLVAAAAAVLAASAAIAVSRDGSTYSVEEVKAAFATSGFTLDEPSTAAYGWTAYGPTAFPPGAFLFPEPVGGGEFYVLVADSDGLAREFYEALTQLGPGAGVLDLREGNVVVSSDASLAPEGLSADERRRIRSAMSVLAGG